MQIKNHIDPLLAEFTPDAVTVRVANAVFGGTGEYLALWLKQQHVESYFYIYVAVMSAIALAVALIMRDTKAHSLILED